MYGLWDGKDGRVWETGTNKPLIIFDKFVKCY